MLEEVAREQFDGEIYRLAGRRSIQRTAAKLGLTGDDLRDFEDAIGAESIAQLLLADPFEEKVIPDMPPFGFPTRFGDGSYPVFYASLSRETSEVELRHHRQIGALANVERRLTVHLWAYRCRLNGQVADVRTKHADWPWLTLAVTVNSDCQALGIEARDSVDALLAPSARHAGGTTVPTFNQGALSEPEIVGTTVFSFDEAAATMIIRRV